MAVALIPCPVCRVRTHPDMFTSRAGVCFVCSGRARWLHARPTEYRSALAPLHWRRLHAFVGM